MASLALAKVAGASFIRTDYFVDRMSRDEYGGQMYINPDELISYRKKIGAEDVLLLTDIQVKFAKLLEKDKPIELSAKQAVKAGSDAVIVTGDFTGLKPSLVDLKKVKLAVGNFPVLVGSGFAVDNALDLLTYADGAIVGTTLNENKRVQVNKVKALIRKVAVAKGG